MKKLKLTFLLFLVTLNFYSQEFINVSDITEYNEAIKKAKPGTTIILSNGVWSDVNLKAYGKGTAESPITIKAKKPGKVIISGDSSLKIYGEHIIVEGLWFRDGNPTTREIVSFRNNDKEYATNCRFTNNAITYFNPNYSSLDTRWVVLWGKNNRVDHNTFTGKKNEGPTLVVRLKSEADTNNNHSIDSNFFGFRQNLGKKNAETIRIGTSAKSMLSSKTLVENNIFKKCNGDLEIISSKACDNIFRNNLFLESEGSLTLRHGNNSIVEENVFIGKNLPNTGGIRISSKGQIIRNNLLVGIEGKGNRAPLVIMNGIPNSPLNGYHQLDGADIQNNTFIDCSPMDFSANKDDVKILPATNTIFANNLIKNKTKSNNIKSSKDIDGIEFKNNFIETTGEFNRYLFKNKEIEWVDVESILRPAASNDFLISDFKNSNSPQEDITGAKKEPFSVGAINIGNKNLPKALNLKSGANWDTNVVVPKFRGRTISVSPGTGTLEKAIKSASGKTRLILRDGIYYLGREQKINGDVTIQGNKKTIIQSEESLAKQFKSFFKINGNSKLTIKNVTLDGQVNTMKYAIISPSKGDTSPYSLFMDDCTVKNFNHESGYLIRGYPNTVADTISIKNTYFENAYRGITFHSKENVDLSAKNILLENSVFKDIQSFALKYQKPASITEKKGKLVITNCIFSNVSNNEQGKILELKGVSSVNIRNSVFEKSKDIITALSLSGRDNIITNCLFSTSGDVKLSKGAIKKDILYKKPKWKDKINFTPNKRSPLLRENNGVDNIGVY